jgi:hypothetical protein
MIEDHFALLKVEPSNVKAAGWRLLKMQVGIG